MVKFSGASARAIAKHILAVFTHRTIYAILSHYCTNQVKLIRDKFLLLARPTQHS